MAWLFMLSIIHPAIAAETAYQGFQSPTGIVEVADVGIYVTDWSANTVTRIDTQGRRSVIVKDLPAAAGLAIDDMGSLFITSYSADYILRIDPDGATRRISGNLSTPTGIAFAHDGRLLVANRGSGEVISLDVSSGQVKKVADSLSLPVGVVEMADGSIVVSQYGGRVTRIMRNGSQQEIGRDFTRPGVGILADGPDAVLIVDNGAGVLRRVSFDGTSSVVADNLSGNAVALGRGVNGDVLIGCWGSGIIYRIQP
ncbi:serine/threonine protein kinase [Affinibrenneria salicis]|uniref:Serine/threonine protein kinase n=2 Tax=Affinibrenneria salicis TaxID=2590031 RepID=A0A5J5G1X5_9GAMM|nr:serine/threonine protein kinase [Affinibrenneria salicis]